MVIYYELLDAFFRSTIHVIFVRLAHKTTEHVKLLSVTLLKMPSKLFIFLTFNTCSILCSNIFESEFNVNDILRTDLMPSYFIVSEDNKQNLTDVSNDTTPPVNGSIDAALSMLDFHR